MLSALTAKFPPAVLALADGSVFTGQSIGAPGTTAGEVVFNTATLGYQEILSDPCACQHIVALTTAHVGNTGVCDEDMESARVQAAGLVVRNLSLVASNFRSQQPLQQWLRAQGVVAIAEVDTRRLARVLRSSGAQGGAIVALERGQSVAQEHIDAALAAARAVPSMQGLDLAQRAGCTAPREWLGERGGEWQLGAGYGAAPAQPRYRVAAYDFGIKHCVARRLVQRGCAVTLLPATTPAAQALASKPDGVFFSGGPGDPQACGYAIEAAREILASGIPVFGIGLGHQIMALAAGARTFKMKFGHHGANHPVKELATGRVSITNQNHDFAVDVKTLPSGVRVTHVSLFDGTLQGLEWADRPAFCFQGHPKGSPGLRDTDDFFDRFIKNMAAAHAA